MIYIIKAVEYFVKFIPITHYRLNTSSSDKIKQTYNEPDKR